MNGRQVANNQVIISGGTGMGKTNLLAVLLHELRSGSIESHYPVNFLLFDYKGEFSDPANEHWWQLFEIDHRAILDPARGSLPFTPFMDFTGATQTEINLYATELAEALRAIDRTSISANMSDRLARAVINTYRRSGNKPFSLHQLYTEYTDLQEPREKEKVDSVKAMLNQLIRADIFSVTDKVDLIKGSYIIKMDGFPKDGVLAKAIVYFTISKLNLIYEHLPAQAKSEECVEIRHFTIIDEAHYMLDFDNKPLRNLIAVGRNKGMSIILATQNMESYRSEYFDFYANAQYPLIMKQQTINDKVIKDLFGVSGGEFQEIKELISNLQKGEIIIKNATAAALGMGKKYKKIKVTHLI
jgi:type IV secretory pathway VirB4 component